MFLVKGVKGETHINSMSTLLSVFGKNMSKEQIPYRTIVTTVF